MKVKSLMTPEPRICTRETNLAEAAALMLDADCGILPVVDSEGKPSNTARHGSLTWHSAR
jgi:CBS domain-containing protein